MMIRGVTSVPCRSARIRRIKRTFPNKILSVNKSVKEGYKHRASALKQAAIVQLSKYNLRSKESLFIRYNRFGKLYGN